MKIVDVLVACDTSESGYRIVELEDARFAFVWGNLLVRVGDLLPEQIPTAEAGVEIYEAFAEAETAYKNCAKAILESNRRSGLSILRALHRVDLRSDDLHGADLQDANLQDANLRYANLQDANLQNADLQDANLQNANLRYADLQDANLQDANLRYADLQDANLQDANLRYADLQDANLHDANLQGANLCYANLQNANLRGSQLSHTTVLPTGESWAVYVELVIPDLLQAGGRSLREVLAENSWDCHSWENCPMARAFAATNEHTCPVLYRPRVRQFIQFFDARLLPEPPQPPQIESQ